MREILTTNGKSVVVDDDDYDRVAGYKWSSFLAGKSWYVNTKIDGKTAYIHRLITGAPAGMDVDHLDGDGLNNQRNNLRVCTHQQNQQNTRKPDIPTSSIYKGVTKSNRGGKKVWAAQVKHNKKHIHCGNFETQEEAARAYNAKAMELFGEFANLNEIK
jgi:hypothetical protein